MTTSTTPIYRMRWPNHEHRPVLFARPKSASSAKLEPCALLPWHAGEGSLRHAWPQQLHEIKTNT